MDYRVEPLRREHLAGVAALETECFAEPWSEQALSLFCGEGGFGVVCTDETGEVLAYGGMLTVLDEGQITNVATHERARRRGLATRVLVAMLDEARARGLREVTLEVRESNAAAIALYERHGFLVVGKRPRFYTHPTEAALVMACAL